MLFFRDVHHIEVAAVVSPTCIGCRKRWACQAAREAAPTPTSAL
jgi:hypothetical protein